MINYLSFNINDLKKLIQSLCYHNVKIEREKKLHTVEDAK